MVHTKVLDNNFIVKGTPAEIQTSVSVLCYVFFKASIDRANRLTDENTPV